MEVTTASPAYAIAEVTVPATVTYEGVTYSVTGIGDKAFMGNSTLTSITLPDGLKRIGTSAFQSCSKLETVNMGNTVETLGENAFFSCSKVTSLALSKTVKSVGKWGLRAMSSLTTLTLGESLVAVRAGMCWGNTKLKGITIPDKVTVIGENAFASCSALDSIQLGEKVDSLAGKAFAYVQSYKKLICRAPIPPKCGDEKSLGATAVYTKATLYVKEKSLDAYQKTEPWKNFTTILNRLTVMFFEDRADFIASFDEYDLLIIDDLGVERSTEYAMEQMFFVIDSRYRSRRPMIITTNLKLSELKNPPDLAHARIYDRILERCAPILFDGKNFREENAGVTRQAAKDIVNSKHD